MASVLPDPVQVGPYVVLDRLGEGGMGAVYLGRHSLTGELAAIKVIRREHAHDSVFRKRFEREIAVAKDVHGGFIARVIDSGITDGSPWFAAEYIPGPTLQEAVQTALFTGEPLADLVVGLFQALAAVHAAGIIHRDLKPQNIILGTTGPRVVDFGIAHKEGFEPLTGGGVIGTFAYMAPEQMRAHARPQASWDIFAFGNLLVYAATGRTAFAGNTPEVVLASILGEEPNLGGVPASIRRLVALCLEKNPARRMNLAAIAHLLPKPLPKQSPGTTEWLPPLVATRVLQEADEAYRRLLPAPQPNRRREVPIRPPGSKPPQVFRAAESRPAPAPRAPRSVQPARPQRPWPLPARREPILRVPYPPSGEGIGAYDAGDKPISWARRRTWVDWFWNGIAAVVVLSIIIGGTYAFLRAREAERVRPPLAAFTAARSPIGSVYSANPKVPAITVHAANPDGFGLRLNITTQRRSGDSSKYNLLEQACLKVGAELIRPTSWTRDTALSPTGGQLMFDGALAATGHVYLVPECSRSEFLPLLEVGTNKGDLKGILAKKKGLVAVLKAYHSDTNLVVSVTATNQASPSADLCLQTADGQHKPSSINRAHRNYGYDVVTFKNVTEGKVYMGCSKTAKGVKYQGAGVAVP